MMKIIPVEIIALLEEPNLQAPVIVLHSRIPNRVIPIWIGNPEAKAIAVALQNIHTDRPLTHKLMVNTIRIMGGVLGKVVISQMQGNTFFAELHIARQNQHIIIDSRPSDAITIAIEAKVPIFVASELLNRAGQENPFEIDRMAKMSSEKKFSSDDIEKLEKALKLAQAIEQKESGKQD